MTGYSHGKHDDPADTQDRLVRIGTKYQATAPAVGDGDNVYLLVDSAGRLLVTGAVAHDAPDAGNPVKIGGKAVTGSPGAVANGDRVDAHFDEYGRQAVILARDGSTEVASVSAPADGSTQSGWTSLKTQAQISLAPPGDTTLDMAKSIADSGFGAGRLAVGLMAVDASEVKAIAVAIGATRATRATALTPTSGKKVRIISVEAEAYGLTTNPDAVYIYFGTGAAYTTTPANVIAILYPGTKGSDRTVVPDGGGPVGAADGVVSWLTETETETQLILTIIYREE